MIANIVDGLPGPDATSRATLVVAPEAILQQWARELEKHVHRGILNNVQIYHPRFHPRTPEAAQNLQRCDVVLTSYTSVLRSIPKRKPLSKKNPKEEEERWQEELHINKGVLHKAEWFRICLDECQAVKNHESSIAKAVTLLSGKHKWAMSGSPLQNDVGEFYSYFKFLGILDREIETYREFKKKYCSGSVAISRLRDKVTEFMVRRTFRSKIFGLLIVPLPEITRSTNWLELDQFEQGLYDIVEKRFLAIVGTWHKDGDLEDKFWHIFEMLLRLRQLCSVSLTSYTCDSNAS